MKGTKLGVIAILIPVLCGLVFGGAVYLFDFVVPTVQIHNRYVQIPKVPWQTVKQIKNNGGGNCTSLAFLLMDKLDNEQAYFLIVDTPKGLHAAVLLNGLVMDPTIGKVFLYADYLHGKTFVDKVNYLHVNSYVGMAVFDY